MNSIFRGNEILQAKFFFWFLSIVLNLNRFIYLVKLKLKDDKLVISSPTNFEHTLHVHLDHTTGDFIVWFTFCLFLCLFSFLLQPSCLELCAVKHLFHYCKCQIWIEISTKKFSFANFIIVFQISWSKYFWLGIKRKVLRYFLDRTVTLIKFLSNEIRACQMNGKWACKTPRLHYTNACKILKP